MESAIAFSDSGSEGGESGGVRLYLGVIRAELVKTVVKLTLGALLFQVRVEMSLDIKLSQPLLMAIPKPAGCSRVGVETWPECLAW